MTYLVKRSPDVREDIPLVWSQEDMDRKAVTVWHKLTNLVGAASELHHRSSTCT